MINYYASGAVSKRAERFMFGLRLHITQRIPGNSANR
jgi:hypothetical protein